MTTVQISPRLMPGVRIGNAWVSAEPTNDTDRHGKPIWRYAIDTPDFEHEGSDLAGWDDAQGMLGTLLAFLEACAEARAYETRTGRDSENSDLFPEHVGEWAELYSDEIGMARFELEEGE